MTQIKTEQILHALSLHHDPREWAFFAELRIGTGFGKDKEQRLDAWAIHYHPSKQNVTVSYEIKASRTDLMRELATPIKRRASLRLSNEMYFVTPKGMCKIEEIPVECGLIEVDENNKLKTIIKAPFRNIMPPTMSFIASLARRHDVYRKAYILALTEFQEKVREIDEFSQTVLSSHIDKWRNYNYGSREIPDRILQAMEAVMWDLKTTIEESGYFSKNLE